MIYRLSVSVSLSCIPDIVYTVLYDGLSYVCYRPSVAASLSCILDLVTLCFTVIYIVLSVSISLSCILDIVTLCFTVICKHVFYIQSSGTV